LPGFRQAKVRRGAGARDRPRVDSTADCWLDRFVPDDTATLLWELQGARQTIIDLMPDELALLMSSYVQHPAAEHAEWLERTVDTLLGKAIALPRPASPSASGVGRVYCPLCRHGRQDPYAQGFAFPEGLRRHLMGDHGGRRCRVLLAAHSLAKQHWENAALNARPPEHSRPRSLAVAAAKPSPAVAWRYHTGPECGGLAIAEHSGQPRSDEELVMAEHRLRQLGFVCLRSERSLVSYTRAIEGHVIYADPRAAGTIWFHCYRRSPGLAARGWEQRFPSFKLRDSAKLGLLDKFEAWLELLLSSQLSPLPAAVAPRVESGPVPVRPASAPAVGVAPVRRAAR
jgi:hypothetical protein